MSLYQDTGYFTEYLTDLTAPNESPAEVQDLDGGFRNVMDGKNYDLLQHLRIKPKKGDQFDAKSLAPDQWTNVDMKLSANKFAEMIRGLGRPQEAEMVLQFLKGVSEYDFA